MRKCVKIENSKLKNERKKSIWHSYGEAVSQKKQTN